jgi:uncharacterized membrane protein YbhN (UPF0104 family)
LRITQNRFLARFSWPHSNFAPPVGVNVEFVFLRWILVFLGGFDVFWVSDGFVLLVRFGLLCAFFVLSDTHLSLSILYYTICNRLRVKISFRKFCLCSFDSFSCLVLTIMHISR